VHGGSRKSRRGRIPPVVWLLGLASLLNDASSEAIYPLLPVFLMQLGGGLPFLGLVEGAADALAAVVKVVAGRLSDRGPRRLLVVGGYALPAVGRSIVAAAAQPWHVLAGRLVDRLGKGVRSGPRDALLADAVEAADRGRAFGVQRSMDHLGAAAGPLLAAGMIGLGATLRTTFLVAAALGMLAALLLAWRLRDPREAAPAGPAPGRSGPGDAPAPLPRPFWRYLALAGLFALGNSSDAFLLVKATEVGFSPAALPLLWAGHHAVKTLTGAPGGALSDRLPRGWVVASGWAAFAAAYTGFALARTPLQVALLFGAYALYHGLTEAAERALVADVAGPGMRGRAFGWYHGVTGLLALPAGLLTGLLWQWSGAKAALLASAAIALAAALGLAASPGLRRPPGASAAGGP
jgi:predicted MFS family arabinose efflux permease